MNVVSRKHQNLLRTVIPNVNNYYQRLNSLNQWWGKISLIGKINSQNVAASILDEMQYTKDKFSELQSELIQSLIKEHWDKLVAEDLNKSQVAIDILIRNLFERTADVGFLATDNDIRNFLLTEQKQPEEHLSIRQRLQEYVKKYSVYNDIIVFDTHGVVQTNLDPKNTLTQSSDPLIAETLSSREDYVETFRHSDIQPHQTCSLIYSCAIRSSNDKHGKVIGVLCLCFRFEDEMEGIFTHLLPTDSASVITLVAKRGNVIASSNENKIPLDSRLPRKAQLDVVTYSGDNYLTTISPTKGYQDFYGLNWSAQVMTSLSSAFNHNNKNALSDNGLTELLQSELFPEELTHIYKTSTLVKDDLNLVVLNGIIASARQNAVEFMPVLEEIKKIGEDITDIFSDSIHNLLSTVIDSRLEDVRFRAALTVDLMDRNLYERANDCRWWALTTAFKTLLQQPSVSASEQAEIAAILAYINDLYTVYTNLYIYDTQGVILAVSNPTQQYFVGKSVETESGAHAALRIKNSQKYTVSDFSSSGMYNDRHTYIYNASITDLTNNTVVGGIGIVFDSEPQFAAMLNDALPIDSSQNAVVGSFALYCQRNGLIVSATEHSPKKVGEYLVVSDTLFAIDNGQRHCEILTFMDKRYAMGVAASKGYREYKTTNDYENDILGFVFVPS